MPELLVHPFGAGGQPALPQRRKPVWSGVITAPLATFIPSTQRLRALSAIKAIHTAIFFSIAGAVLLTLWDGLRGRPGRRTAIAGGVVFAESALFVSNNQVCPLTPLAEELGAERGSVVDIFLPAWAARRIPIVAGGAAVLALVLNLRAWHLSTPGGSAS
jgi:hypothetical protein